MKNKKTTYPEYENWQDVASPATIKFVRDAKIILEYSNDNIPKLDKAILEEVLQLIKEGQLFFTKWTDPLDYISTLKKGDK